MRGWPRFLSFPQDGRLWMLAWLGPFFDDQQDTRDRAMTAYIVPVKKSAKRSPAQLNKGHYPRDLQLDWQSLRPITLDAGHLTSLSIGMLFRNGKLISPRKPLLWRYTFTVDALSQQALRLNDTGPLTIQQLHFEAASPSLSHAAYLRLTDDQGRTILIPALEVLRWNYGSSSRVLQQVFSGEITDTLATIKKESSWHGTEYQMPLPHGFLDTDAPLLAALATEATAEYAAKQVHLSISTGQHQNTFFPKAAFPVIGTNPVNEGEEAHHWQSTTLLGRFLDTERQTFLAHQILAYPTHFLFERVRLPDDVVYTQDDSPPEADTSKTQRTIRAKVRNASRLSIKASQAPRNQTALRLPALPAQFSEFTAITRDKLQTPGTGIPPARRHTSPGKQFSSAPGTDKSSDTNRATLAADPSDTPQNETPVNANYFDTLRKAVALLPSSFSRTERPVNAPGCSEGRFANWHKSNGERIACLIIEIQTSEKQQTTYRYLLEKERIGGSFGPLILAQKENGTQATDTELSSLMDTRASGTTWPKTVAGWLIKAIPHLYAHQETYAAGLKKHLTKEA